MNGEPKNNNLSSVKLSEELENLIEQIAENIHNAWMKKRCQNGWKYGGVYNNATKEHPCLVEFNKLSEEEKEIDRVTARCTIKMLLNLGYSIERRDG